MSRDVGILFRLICLVIVSLQCGQQRTSNRRQTVPPLMSFSGRDWKHLIEFKFKCFKASCCLAVTSLVFFFFNPFGSFYLSVSFCLYFVNYSSCHVYIFFFCPLSYLSFALLLCSTISPLQSLILSHLSSVW